MANNIFIQLCQQNGIPPPTTEYRFHPVRRWKMDYAWVSAKIALEVEGGVFSGGRHTRGAGFLKDCEKYNSAALLGWIVLRVTPSALCTAETVDMIRQARALVEASK